MTTILGTNDLGGDGETILLALLNNKEGTNKTFNDFYFSNPVPVLPPITGNTLIELIASPTSQYRGKTTIWYNRIDAKELGVITVPKGPANTLIDVLPIVNEQLGIFIKPTDVIDYILPFPDSNGLVTLSITFSDTSVIFKGTTDTPVVIPTNTDLTYTSNTSVVPIGNNFIGKISVTGNINPINYELVFNDDFINDGFFSIKIIPVVPDINGNFIYQHSVYVGLDVSSTSFNSNVSIRIVGNQVPIVSKTITVQITSLLTPEYFTTAIYPLLISDTFDGLKSVGIGNGFILETFSDKVTVSSNFSINNVSLIESIIHKNFNIPIIDNVILGNVDLDNASLIDSIVHKTHSIVDSEIVSLNRTVVFNVTLEETIIRLNYTDIETEVINLLSLGITDGSLT
jgi:hypothetical protein